MLEPKDEHLAANRAERRASASRAQAGRTKFGWKPREWAVAACCSRSYTYMLLAAGEIESVKLGRARVILTDPEDFLRDKVAVPATIQNSKR
jgi:hypothetical protein